MTAAKERARVGVGCADYILSMGNEVLSLSDAVLCDGIVVLDNGLGESLSFAMGSFCHHLRL